MASMRKIKGIGIGGLLHDIGKVKIPNEILNKPGPLTEAEFEVMKQHVVYGNALLAQTPDLDASSVCVTAHHHERLTAQVIRRACAAIRRNFGQVCHRGYLRCATSERC
jgi:hypothetical protein